MSEKINLKFTLEDIEKKSPEELGKLLKEKLTPYFKRIGEVACFVCIPCGS